MHYIAIEQSVGLAMRERQQQAETHNRAARIAALRKWERREAAAGRRARAARSAIL